MSKPQAWSARAVSELRAWAGRAVGAAGVAVLTAAVLVWLPGVASAGFLSGGAASATYTTAVLGPPTALGTSVSGSTVTLTWTLASSPAPTGTQILRAATAAGPYTAIASVTSPTATYDDTPGVGVWYYEAASYRGSWTSAATGPVSATVVAVPAWRGQVAAGSSAAGGTTLTLVTTSAVAAGDLLTVRTAIGSAASVISVTDSAGDTYVRQASVAQHKAVTSELWTAAATGSLNAGASVTVTWSRASGSAQAVVVDEFSGTTPVADGSATASGRSNSPSATTTAVVGDLVLGVTAAVAGQGGYTEASGWSALGATGPGGASSNALAIYGGWQIAGATTVTHNPSLNASTDWTEVDVALRPG